MNVRLTIAAAILATAPLVALAAAANATDNYQDTVRQALHDAGYEVPDTTGATTVLNEARDLVCQNKNTSADVVDTQLQQAGWFNHPSLDRKQAEAIRTVALNYCPNN
jgi:hypothetical protein